MNRAAFSTFGTLGFMLCGLMAFELHAALSPHDALIPAVSALTAATQPDSSSGNPPPPASIQAWTAAVQARPLFNPSRLPPAAAVKAAHDLHLPRLSAIMISPTQTIAVFSPANGKPIIVTKGAHLGAYAVRAITADSVTVDGPHGISVLHTGFNSHGASSAVAVDQTALPGGIILDQIKIPLPDASHWPGPPSIIGEK